MTHPEILERIARLPAPARAVLRERLRVLTDGDAQAGGLVAYAVPREPAPTPTDLRGFLLERLPAHVVPSAYVLVAELPLLSSGKVDRHALRDLGTVGTSVTPYLAPRTPTEEKLAAIWSEILQISRVGVHDDFWTMGGQSVLASMIVTRARLDLQVEMEINDLFEEPTIAGLARRIESTARAGGARSGVPLVTAPPGADRPLSSAEYRHWFLQALNPESSAYHIGDAFRVRGPLDVAALETAFTEVTRRHETLRTAYPTVRGMPRPEVVAPEPVAIPLTDLRALPAAEREGAALAGAGELVRRAFDLEQPRLLRAALWRLADQDHLLTVAAHHIVADDIAFTVLYRELAECYQAAVAGRPVRLPVLPVQYADYAVWERRMLGEGTESALKHWRRELAPAAHSPPITADVSVAGEPAGAGATHAFVVPADLVRAVRSWSAARGTTLFAVALAAFAEVISRRDGRSALVVGVPFANRPRPELEQLIGCFINPAGVVVDRSGAVGFEQAVQQAHDRLMAAHRHQHVPFDRVVEALRINRDRGSPALFDVVLNFTDAPPVLRLAGTETENIDLGELSEPKYAVTLYATGTEQALSGRFVYRADVFGAETVAAFADRFVELLRAVAPGE
jgi:hypothetical protein